MARRRQLAGIRDDEELDRSGLERLKKRLKKESKAIRVK